LGFGLSFNFGIIRGLSAGIAMGLSYGIIRGLILGLNQELKDRSYPNQGIWNSSQSFLWTTVLSYPFSVISTMVILVLFIDSSTKEVTNTHDLSKLFFDSLKGGCLGALCFGFFLGGGIACVQHFCLRLVLWQSGTIPWNFARFLNYCVERRLLLRVGGRYRFLHRELLDYFAQLPPGTQIK
jgi:hypothetical protein